MQEITDTQIMPAHSERGDALGRYVLVREAGRGGMSVVHEARDTRNGRTVAVKVLAVPPGLPPEQAGDMLARFGREANAVAGLSHPNIVAIHELGEDAGRHFLVMEYLRGETLRGRLGRGPLTPAQALPVLRQVADAVDAVHAQGVVHRDIKPSNVMLLPDGTAKLLDFGVARQSDDVTITGTGALVGSPAYMAPEQVRGGAGTPASDVWALGALLYEMLAGRPPFTGNSIPSVLYQVSHENPAPIAGLTTPVQRVLRRALDKNPARRYASARALAESLAAAVSSQQAPKLLRYGVELALAAAALLGLGAFVLRPHLRPAPRAPVAPLIGTTGGAASTPPAPLKARPHPGRPVLSRPRHLRAVRHKTEKKQVKKSRTVIQKFKRAALSHPVVKAAHKARTRQSLRPRNRVKTEKVARQPRESRRPTETARRTARPAGPPPHRGGDDFDPAASERLQKFIYPVGH